MAAESQIVSLELYVTELATCVGKCTALSWFINQLIVWQRFYQNNYIARIQEWTVVMESTEGV